MALSCFWERARSLQGEAARGAAKGRSCDGIATSCAAGGADSWPTYICWITSLREVLVVLTPLNAQACGEGVRTRFVASVVSARVSTVVSTGRRRIAANISPLVASTTTSCTAARGRYRATL
eukprot:scaffold22447_cov70-Phaeocystis_antarctica.AAC.3